MYIRRLKATVNALSLHLYLKDFYPLRIMVHFQHFVNVIWFPFVTLRILFVTKSEKPNPRVGTVFSRNDSDLVKLFLTNTYFATYDKYAKYKRSFSKLTNFVVTSQ